jgi:hypothetical protein
MGPRATLRRAALIVALSGCAVCALPAGLCAQPNPDDRIGIQEEESRFLPGIYFFHKGCEYYKRGQPAAAMQAWQVAASWAMKDAQYDLGIAYFRGLDVSMDRPRGIAWLALAAERKDEAFAASLAAAWDQATPAEQDRANAIWRDLKKYYGDASALPRAERRYKLELDNITGSRVGMPGHVTVWTPAAGLIDVELLKSDLRRRADINFGKLPSGTVDVGPLEPVVDDRKHNADSN